MKIIVMLAFLTSLPCLGGTASWYGQAHAGLPTASGELFDPTKLTAASWFFPMGTRLTIKHKGKSVVVRINDKGPSRRLVKQGRVIDLSQAAFARIADTNVGLITVRIIRK